MTLLQYLDKEDPYWILKVQKDYKSGIKLSVIVNKIIEDHKNIPDLKFNPKTFRLSVDNRLKQLYKKDEPKKKQNFTIVANQIPEEKTTDWDGCETIRFGIVSDTHIGSKYWQPTYLKDFYNLLSEEGIDTVYHAGDITDGIKMRPGHEFDLYAVSADDQVKEVIERYPCIPGIRTYFITGNHDASVYKHVGYDIGKAIASDRSDMIYIGRDCARVHLTPNCVMELRHPWDGSAYALSYKPQKMMDALDPDTKPNILIIGHYHKAEYVFYRNIHSLQAGCFQTQTPFTRGKGISVHTGGWIVEVKVDKEGTVKMFTPTFIPFYKGINDDYKNI